MEAVPLVHPQVPQENSLQPNRLGVLLPVCVQLLSPQAWYSSAATTPTPHVVSVWGLSKGE